MRKRRALLTPAIVLTLAAAAGCHKKAPPPPPPPPPQAAPAPAKPTINYFTAEPSTITSGESATLRWSVTNATTVEIDNGIGQVSPDGRRAVTPTATTEYTLTATNAGGTSTATATVTVSTPPPPAAPPAQPSATPAQIIAQQVHDIHFDYDKSDIRPSEEPIVQQDAAALKQIFAMDPNFSVTVEGHCDERGSAEYNLALGDRRAESVKNALVSMGVPASNLKTISYGKERPLCTESTEECWARNRRVHFSAGQ